MHKCSEWAGKTAPDSAGEEEVETDAENAGKEEIDEPLVADEFHGEGEIPPVDVSSVEARHENGVSGFLEP